MISNPHVSSYSAIESMMQIGSEAFTYSYMDRENWKFVKGGLVGLG